MGLGRQELHEIWDRTARAQRVIELTPEAFKEIEEKLIAAGYQWLVFPPSRGIVMDGFTIVPMPA